jgi:hypothetical protein
MWDAMKLKLGPDLSPNRVSTVDRMVRVVRTRGQTRRMKTACFSNRIRHPKSHLIPNADISKLYCWNSLA